MRFVFPLAVVAASACENFLPRSASWLQFFTEANVCAVLLLELLLELLLLALLLPLLLELLVAVAVVVVVPVVVAVLVAAASEADFLLPQPAATITSTSRNASELALNLISVVSPLTGCLRGPCGRKPIVGSSSYRFNLGRLRSLLRHHPQQAVAHTPDVLDECRLRAGLAQLAAQARCV